jgi:exoribonuclease R
MKKLAVLMNQRREERGSIDFDLPEPVIEFDEHGQMRGVTRPSAPGPTASSRSSCSPPTSASPLA